MAERNQDHLKDENALRNNTTNYNLRPILPRGGMQAAIDAKRRRIDGFDAGRFECQACKKRCYTRQSLTLHEKKCGTTTAQEKSLQGSSSRQIRIEKSLEEIMQSKPVECERCKERFKNARGLGSHKRKCLNKEMRVVGDDDDVSNQERHKKSRLIIKESENTGVSKVLGIDLNKSPPGSNGSSSTSGN